MLSMKAKYGLRAMLFLARAYGQGPALISEIAEKEAIPKKFLELILLELRNKGYLHSKKGKGGGYYLGKSPYQISLGEIIRILDGPLAPIPCVSLTAYRRCPDCPDEKTCGIRVVMKEVRDSTAEILDGTTLADVILRTEQLSDRAQEALSYQI